MTTLAVLLATLGGILLLVGLVGGGFTFYGNVMPTVGKRVRLPCFIIGVVLLIIGIRVAFVQPTDNVPPASNGINSSTTTASSSPAASEAISSPPSTSVQPSSNGSCTFDSGSTAPCQSTNPQIVVDSVAFSDTSACVGDFQITWGDTTEESVLHQGGPPGPHFLASHTYTAPGTYTISVTATPVSGGCTYSPGTYSFTLLSS